MSSFRPTALLGRRDNGTGLDHIALEAIASDRKQGKVVYLSKDKKLLVTIEKPRALDSLETDAMPNGVQLSSGLRVPNEMADLLHNAAVSSNKIQAQEHNNAAASSNKIQAQEHNTPLQQAQQIATTTDNGPQLEFTDVSEPVIMLNWRAIATLLLSVVAAILLTALFFTRFHFKDYVPAVSKPIAQSTTGGGLVDTRQEKIPSAGTDSPPKIQGSTAPTSEDMSAWSCTKSTVGC